MTVKVLGKTKEAYMQDQLHAKHDFAMYTKPFDAPGVDHVHGDTAVWHKPKLLSSDVDNCCSNSGCNHCGSSTATPSQATTGVSLSKFNYTFKNAPNPARKMQLG